MESFNLVFASDREYLPHLSVAIASLIAHNPDAVLNFYIITSDINSSEWENLVGLDYQKKHLFINSQIDHAEIADLPTAFHFTSAIYWRLFIDEIVPYDKALYIDSDVVVNGSLSELWNTKIDGFYLAAVEEPIFRGHNELGLSINSKYFNSGVMLLNLDMWRKNSLRKKVLEFIRKKPHTIKYGDQCALNAVVDGNWVSVSPKYNMQTAILAMENSVRKLHYNFNEIDEAVNCPVIVHYTGSSKPWHLRNNHPFKKLYWEHLNQTAYKRLLPSDFTIINFIIWTMPKWVKNLAKRFYKCQV